MDRRLNIGLLIDDLNNHFTNQACKGAEIAARAIDANLYIIPGHYIGDTDSRYKAMEYEYQYNTVFSLPNEQMVDIIYVLIGTIGSRAPEEMQLEFLKRMPNVPVVSIFSRMAGYPNVVADNRSGIHKLMEHFNSHGYTKYGYVSGPLTNKDARERIDALKDELEFYGYDSSDRRFVEGDFTDTCHDAVRKLMDNNPDLEVILFGNDRMASCGYEVIRERGLEPGKDIFVAGFDDDYFAASMEPPLTTIEINSADLAYKAILHAEDFIEKKIVDDIMVETFLVQRSSCGCDGLNIEALRSRLYLDKILEGNRKCVSSCEKYWFGIFQDQGDIVNVKAAARNFIDCFADYVIDGATSEGEKKMRVVFDAFMKAGAIEYINSERLVNIISVLHHECLCDVSDERRWASINSLFADFFKRLSVDGLAVKDNRDNRNDGITRLVNIQTGELFIMSDDEGIHYEHLVDGFNTIGFNGAYIYLFQGNNQNKPGTVWKAPNTCLLKGYCGPSGDAIALPEEQQLIRTERIFINEFTNNDKSKTMTVFPLFVGEDLYGLFVVDLDTRYLYNVTPIAYQLSVTIKSLNMIEEQNRTKKELQSSLEQFIKDNNLLNEVAKTDELTSLFNRRGFLEYAQRLMNDPINDGRKTLICYADMDNLKMVNDVYGHDEGDFSIRLIAKSLKETFRSSDIVGRLGGDEFVAFAIVDGANYGDIIKERLQSILARNAKDADKPYPIEISVGVTEFNCSSSADIYELLDEADSKLYVEKRAKKATRGSYR